MRIKLAILDSDVSYLNRIVGVFETRYTDKFQLYSFTNPEDAFSIIETAKVDVLVASDSFEIDVKRLPKRCGFAYFVDSMDIDTFNNQRAICKFQKSDLIYKQILSVYSENADNISGIKFGDDSTRIIIFQSVSGGTGASSMAAACAIRFAAAGKRTLYLNFEKFGFSDNFFTAEGKFDFSDVIFALKSKKTNLSMKLESCVKQAENGVYFFSSPKIALDMMELTNDDMLRVITELKLTGSYDYIMVDMDFSLNKEALAVYDKANSIVWVGDGSEISNTKIMRALNALVTLEHNMDSIITDRVALIYNKFSNKTSKALTDIGLKFIGGAPRFEHATTEQILEQLSSKDMFDKLI
ncbi:MAG: chromosome partitioning protein ParA [Ruminiclostridium sp.]|nr:chromosome partitioning protein ParA [Ruminiclostridium sp.]